MAMDARSSTEDKQCGLGSWHPAMRPNAHEASRDKDQQTVETLPDSTFWESNAGSDLQSRQLPFRPKTGSQEQPVLPPSQTVDIQHAGNAVTLSEDAKDRAYEGRGQCNGVDGDGAPSNNATDGDTTLADSVELLQTSGESIREPIHRRAQQASLADVKDNASEILAGSAAGPSNVEDALGDKGEMDRAWELEEEGLPSNTVASAANLNRTNSFPVVRPLLQDRPVPPHSLSLSQAENIIEEEETAEALDRGLSNNNAFTSTDTDSTAPPDPFEAIAEEETDDYFAYPQGAQAQAATSIGGAEEESRYDEGLPLMQSLQPEPMELSEYKKGAEAKAPGSADEGDFFDKLAPESSEEISPFKPRPLDRKSTSQVLDSMHYAPHSAIHTESRSVEDKPSLASLTGGGIAVSAHTVESQVFAEQHGDLPEPKPKDEDLAEIWKAALGDDDLLEEDENPVDPSAFFEDDGEGFLEGSQNQAEEYHPQSVTSPPVLEPVYGSDGKMRGFGETSSRPTAPQNKYLPTAMSQPATLQQLPQGSSSLSHSVSAPTGFTNAKGQPSYAAQAPSRPQMPASTQSFADKSKGGYTSPYDLPMDVTRPKKRSTFQQTNTGPDVQPPSSRPPPPRSSSMFTGVRPPVKSQPPVPHLPNAYSSTPNGNAVPPSLKVSPSMGSFFEELKPSSKPRPPNSMGKFMPPAHQPTPPPPVSSQREPLRQSSLPQPPIPKATENLQPYQLLPPERMSLYGNGAQTEPTGQSVPAVNARYSPAPSQKINAPPPSNRYAASPSIGGRPPPSPALPFQPRTSSPLAQSRTSPPHHQRGSMSDPSLCRPQSSGRQSPSAQEPGAPSFPFLNRQSPQNIDPSAYRSESTGTTGIPFHSRPPSPPTQNAPLSNFARDPSYAMKPPVSDNSVFDRQASYQQSREIPSYAPTVPDYGLLRRSQTSSPGAGKYIPEAVGAQRPASVNNQVSASSADNKTPFSNQARRRGNTFSKDLNYIKPTDGRELDPLERWKGSPIISFGFGGAIVTSFPAQVPRYAAGQPIPMIKCSLGEITLQDGKILPLEEGIATFPGPLKSKGKKKDVLDWLQSRIVKMEQNVGAYTSSVTLPDPSKRHDEKTILWKIVRVLVENDGAIDHSPSAESAIRSILSPELTQGDNASLPFGASNASLLGITRHSGSRAIAGPVSPDAIEGLRKMLLHGKREKAVWHAVDHHLWAHAMLLSSTLDKTLWKQVSQEFVRQEVKTFGDNTEALAALYQIFAGNGDDSADELVPPSARAGLQLVSKTAGTGPTKNALDGLDRWRETLTLILSNRSPDDGNALVNLGRLLANYGRIEAAHICYIFAKLPGLFGGPDDSQVSVALLGADHIQHPFDYGRDLDSILLTEIYDYMRTVLASSSAATVSPHLQSFKLYHAMILAEYGFKSEAQQYCEVITSTLNSTTKRSSYYHNLLLGALDNLVQRLRQAPKDNSGSWISKPSIDKVSGSLWAKFNQYVAGDESDAASTGSGKGRDPAAGPFAGVAGDSPTLSRTPSSNDLYNSYAQGGYINPPAPMPNPSASRYAPASLYTPRSSLEQQGRPTQDIQRPPQPDTLRPAFAHQQYQSRPTSSTNLQQERYNSTPPSTYPVGAESCLPTPPLQPQYMPEPPPEELSSSLYQQGSYQPSLPLEPQTSQEAYQPQLDHKSSSDFQPPSSAYIPASAAYGPPSRDGYEPISSSGYDPPSYNPESPQAEGSPVKEKPKEKSLMEDDEDDFEARAAAIRREEKARKDREADEAFRRAAEADAQKDKAPRLNSKKSGWFGGWLGGKKEGDDAHGTPNAPIKAKLGEQSSFYYDAEKRRWIDKKNPHATPTATATPPPPKGPPSRAVSASGPPPPPTTATPPVPPLPASSTATPPITFTRPPVPNQPSSNPPSQYPSRSASPALNPSIGQATETSAPSPPSGPPLAPPSRPPTAMSGASSIDDLIGVPQARKGGTIRKAKKKGYVDVMAK